MSTKQRLDEQESSSAWVESPLFMGMGFPIPGLCSGYFDSLDPSTWKNYPILTGGYGKERGVGSGRVSVAEVRVDGPLPEMTFFEFYSKNPPLLEKVSETPVSYLGHYPLRCLTSLVCLYLNQLAPDYSLIVSFMESGILAFIYPQIGENVLSEFSAQVLAGAGPGQWNAR